MVMILTIDGINGGISMAGENCWRMWGGWRGAYRGWR